MTTICNILRTNRTMARVKVRDNKDDFKFEGGLYFIEREKVYITKTSIRGKIKPTLLFIEGISQALNLDNLKIKEYMEDVVVLDEKTHKPVMEEIKGYDGKITLRKKVERKLIKKLEDIFIDARAIHNMTDKQILSVLSATDDISATSIILIILCVVIMVLIIIGFFV